MDDETLAPPVPGPFSTTRWWRMTLKELREILRDRRGSPAGAAEMKTIDKIFSRRVSRNTRRICRGSFVSFVPFAPVPRASFCN